MTEGATVAPPRPQQALGRQQRPAPNRRRLEGLAAGFESAGRATAPPSPATPGLAQGALLGASAVTPARRDTGEVVVAAAAAEARWDRPPPCSGPRPLAGDGAAAPPLPASPCRARRKPRSAPRLSSCGSPTTLVTTRRPLRAAHAASGWRVPRRQPQLAECASEVPRLPRGGRETPRVPNRSAANGAARPRGWERDFREGPAIPPPPPGEDGAV